MHPAKSVIVFTTVSGAGYGLVAVFVAFDVFGLVPEGADVTVLALGLALGMIVAGLVSSTFHLGHPERAWRALSQWRSSWLSREGVMAVVSFLPIGTYGLLRLGVEPAAIATQGAGLVAAVCAVATVICTAMIYASLRPVHAWATPWTPLSYGVLGLMSGAALCNAILSAVGSGSAAMTGVAGVLILLGLAVKGVYWRRLDGDLSPSTTESATGLGAMGKVRLLEAPHTEANYLMREMVFRIARRHSVKLRKLSVIVAFLIPLAALAGSLLLDGSASVGCSILAPATMISGLFIERWLFFAEARHSVGLYYGY